MVERRSDQSAVVLDGTIRKPVDPEDIALKAQALLNAGAEALGIVFINAYANPANEKAALEAARIALSYRTPVFLLSDGYLANGAEPWLVPELGDLPDLRTPFATAPNGSGEHAGRFLPYLRDPVTLARPWAVPGTPGLEHRIGGIEKAPGSGNIDYSPASHQEMTDTRAAKVNKVAETIPDQEICLGKEGAKLAVVGWGSTFGPIHQAVRRMRQRGHDVSHIHVRHIWPLPANLGELLRSYERVIVPEMNDGQFKTVLRDQFLIDAKPVNKVSGHPFKIAEIEDAIEEALA